MNDDAKEEKGITLIRMFHVAMTGTTWEKHEHDWLDAHPKQKQFAEDMRQSARRNGLVGALSDTEIQILSANPQWREYEKRRDELVEYAAPSDKDAHDSFSGRVTKGRNPGRTPDVG